MPCCETGDTSPDYCSSDPTRCDSPTCTSGTDDSRLYKVKAGLAEAVAAYGELEYSLYRFHQTGVASPSISSRVRA